MVEELGEDITKERHKTHGDFAENALMSQGIKNHMCAFGRKGMSDVHKEALDMIAMKISRICSGQSEFRDHWIDIIGYATLALSATYPQAGEG